MKHWLRSAPALLAGIATAGLLWSVPAQAIEIKQVVSPKGIKAWLVEDQSVPLISMNFAFSGGAAQDPELKPGVASMLTGLLDEGAGPMNSEAFQTRLDELSIELGFDAGRDEISGTIQTLAENRQEAMRLLHLALTSPRFDNEPVERIRAQVLSSLRRSERSPGRLASDALMQAAYPGHAYSRPVGGTAESIATISIADLKAFREKTFARDNLKVAIVGAIDPAAAALMLDEVFGALPAKAALVPVPDVEPKAVGRIDLTLPVPQALIRFTAPGIKRDDPDFIPASVAAYILGGGSESRLFRAVREERGLAYSIGIGLNPLEHSGSIDGGTQTTAGQSEAVIDLVGKELARFGDEGPTEAELATAKAYLIGSYPMRFVSTDNIAGQLLAIQMDNLGIDYVDRRNDLIAAVTIDDVRRVAKRLFQAKNFTFVRVGPPES